MEAAMVFDASGVPIYWHVPPDRSMIAIPDSADLWKVLWNNRIILHGVAHTHPWSGGVAPSETDVTTFAAVESGLGKRLVWPIVSFTEVRYFVWKGPEKLDYGEMEVCRFRLHRENIYHLRDLSR